MLMLLIASSEISLYHIRRSRFQYRKYVVLFLEYYHLNDDLLVYTLPHIHIYMYINYFVMTHTNSCVSIFTDFFHLLSPALNNKYLIFIHDFFGPMLLITHINDDANLYHIGEIPYFF